jgi:hypothetical protein
VTERSGGEERLPETRVERVGPHRAHRTHWGPATEARATEILNASRSWERQYGEPPRIADWEPSRARRHGRDHFGTMSATIRAAGRRASTRTRRHLPSSVAVLDALRARHRRRYGEPPTRMDWAPATARHEEQHWRISRYYEGDWPSIVTVRGHYGTLNRAIAAAGVNLRKSVERSARGPSRTSGIADRSELR